MRLRTSIWMATSILLVTNSNSPPRLLRNEGGNKYNWLAVKLNGTTGSRDAIGARVTVRAEGVSQTKEVQSGTGYLSQNELKLYFGLGDSTTIELIEIRWPGGGKQQVKNIAANQSIVITEGGG